MNYYIEIIHEIYIINDIKIYICITYIIMNFNYTM